MKTFIVITSILYPKSLNEQHNSFGIWGNVSADLVGFALALGCGHVRDRVHLDSSKLCGYHQLTAADKLQ